jgi:hypothetical protein
MGDIRLGVHDVRYGLKSHIEVQASAQPSLAHNLGTAMLRCARRVELPELDFPPAR